MHIVTANLPHGLGLETAVHVCNRSPHMSLKVGIPEEVWSGKPASCEHLCIFGYDTFVDIRAELRNKLDAKSMKGIFMNYGDEGQMGYTIWLPRHKKIICSQDVVFNEASLLKNDCAS